MISRVHPQFWKMYRKLPQEVRAVAREKYQMFRANPFHSGLRFKQLRGYAWAWSLRINQDYRAVAERDGDTVTWFWIGSHADFDRDF